MTRPDFRVADVMRLMVETPGDPDTGAANNLVRNPDGATGVWWWTRSTGTLLKPGNPGITFGIALPGNAACQTGYMPVTADTWVSARFDLTAISTTVDNLTVHFEFSDATRAVIGTASQSGGLTTTGTVFMGAAQAPAGTSYVRILASFSTALINAWVTINDVMVTTSASDDFTTTRHNLVPNPSFETGTAGWSAGTGTTSIARVSTSGVTGPLGSWMLAVTTTVQSGRSYADSPPVAVSPGQLYAYQAWMGGGPSYATPGVLLWFYDAAGTLVATIDRPGATSGVITAPAGAATMYLNPYQALTPSSREGFVWHLDKVMVERSSVVGSYFDGSLAAAGDWTYSWDGTPGASASTATLTTDGYDYVSPVEAWTDVLGSANQINVTRATLNTSTLAATIVDPALDPSVDPADLLKKGRRLTLQATHDGGTTWEPIYTGTITDAAVTYVLDNEHPGIARPKIVLTALDAASDLAALLSPNCYATVASVAQAIDVPGNTHPWTCNGDTGIGAAGAGVSVDTGNKMSVLDQIATTRDTVSGLAFIDRAGVVNVWDAEDYTSPVSDTYSDSAAPSYSDLQVGYDEASIVNAVRVVVNSLDAAGSTVSTHWPGGGTVDPGTAGPISSYYVDQDSIDAHGLATATYTINMAFPTSATVAAYAAAILAANATPQRIVTSMTVPVLDADDINRATLTDLCSVIGIEYEGLTAAEHRVQTITHSLTAGNDAPDQWTVAYAFAAPEALAAPQLTPPAAGTVVAGGTSPSGSLATTGVTSGTITYSSRNGTVTVNVNITALSSAIAAGSTRTVVAAGVLPAAYCPSEAAYGGLFTGTAVGFIRVNPSGLIELRASTAAMGAGSGTVTY